MKKVAFYVIFLAVCYLIVEVSLRVFEYVHPLPMFFDKGKNQFRGKPHAEYYGYRLNSHGFKDLEFGKKEEGTYRILGLGDSFAFGVVPYPDNFLTVAEDAIKEGSPGKKVEILNMGISSTGPADQLSLLTEEGLATEPDMVLLNFFIGNDIVESYRSPRKKWLQTYSYTGTLIYSLFQLMSKTGAHVKNSFWSNSTYCDTCPTFSPEEFLKLQTNRSVVFNPSDQFAATCFEHTLYYLERIIRICSSRNIKLVVAIIPDESQVNAELRNQVANNLKKQGDNFSWDNTFPNRWLAQELEKRKVSYIDLLPLFLEQKDTATYVPLDTHWNRYGNRIAGEYLGKALPRYIASEK